MTSFRTPPSERFRKRRMQKSELKMAEGELNVDSLISRLLEGEQRRGDDILSNYFDYWRIR